MPRNRRPPARIDTSSHHHQFSSPHDHYRQIYYQACDLLLRELTDRFDQRELLQQVVGVEVLLLKAANGENYDDAIITMEQSCYSSDIDLDSLRRQLPLLVDACKQGSVTKVTSIRTICGALNENQSYKQVLSDVHKLLRLYLTIPLTSCTAERVFSVQKRVLTYLRSSMTEKRLNNCLLLHAHKDVTDSLNLEEIAEEFASINSERKRYFGSFH